MRKEITVFKKLNGKRLRPQTDVAPVWMMWAINKKNTGSNRTDSVAPYERRSGIIKYQSTMLFKYQLTAGQNMF